MGADSNDVSAQEDQDVSAHLERRGRREKGAVKLDTRKERRTLLILCVKSKRV